MKPKIRFKSKMCTLETIMKDTKYDLYVFEDYVSKLSEIDAHVKSCIRLYILHLLKEEQELPPINEELYKLCAIVFMTKAKGGNTPKGDNLVIIKNLTKFYDDVYSKTGYSDDLKVNCLHMNQILGYAAKEYETSIKNNIIFNFVSYVNRFVNSCFIQKFTKNISEKNKIISENIKNIQKEHNKNSLVIVKHILDVIYSLNIQEKLSNSIIKIKRKFYKKYKSIGKFLNIDIAKPIVCDYSNIYDLVNDYNKLEKEHINQIKILKSTCTKNIVNKQENLKELKKELYKVKQDILNDTNTSDEKYKNWIAEHKDKIIPVFDKKYTTLEYLKEHPQCFIKSMIYMLNILENNNYKMFQFLPLRTSLIPRNICIDTKTLIELFVDDDTVFDNEEHKNKNEYFDDIKHNKQKIWNNIFKLNNKVFKMSKVSPYVFNYKIMTNGYSVALSFIHKDDIEKKDKADNNKQAVRAANKLLYKDKSEEEVKEIKNNKEKTKEEKTLLLNIKNREKQKAKREEFKKLSKEEQEKIKLENRINNDEFQYFDDLPDDKIQYLQEKYANNQLLVNDPGKRYLCTLMNKKGKMLQYSNRQYLKDTKRLVYHEKLHKYKKSLKILEHENELCKYNSRTINYDKFLNFIKKKNEIAKILTEYYKKQKFRQYKWYSYINRERADANIINKIISTYGKDLVIIYGDWSQGKQMKNFISTPNIRLKRKINDHFKVYDLDEYGTSKINSRTFEENENLSLPDKYGTMRELHSILTYNCKKVKIENNSKVSYIKCNLNRDRNAVENMIYIVKYYLKYRRIPNEFNRSENDIKTNKLLDNIILILNSLKEIDLCDAKLETINDALENCKHIPNLNQIIYILKNSVSKKKLLLTDNIIEDDFIKTKLNSVTKELKTDKIKDIYKYSKKTELAELYKIQLQKIL